MRTRSKRCPYDGTSDARAEQFDAPENPAEGSDRVVAARKENRDSYIKRRR